MISSVRFILSYTLLRFTLLLCKKSSRVKDNSSILFLELFPIENAGYQYRAKKWAELFKTKGKKAEVWTIFEDKNEWEHLLNNNPQKFLRKAMWIRFKQIKNSKHFKKVIVRRELLQYNDYGNLFMEKFLLKLHPDAILDFDDDISAAKNEPRKITSTFGKLLQENGTKFTESLNLYSNFIAGSNYLNQLIIEKRGNQNFKSVVIPTCVDYDKHEPKVYNFKHGASVKLGWIGSNGNQALLESIIPALNEVSKSHKIELIVISGKEFKAEAARFPITNMSWSLESEVEDLKKIDIGLMPLDSSVRAKGKCGFKLIQYMGLGIIPLASSITVNKEILKEHPQLLVDQCDWGKALVNLINEYSSFRGISYAVRHSIKRVYSFSQNFEIYNQFILNK